MTPQPGHPSPSQDKRVGSFDSPAAALDALLALVDPVGSERVPLELAAGRILAEPVATDRPSPACDVSAMDGFAVRIADLAQGTLPVSAEARIGTPPVDFTPGAAVRIVTGAPVPAGAEAVVKREDVRELAGAIEISPDAMRGLLPGASIRRQAENALQGTQVLGPGAMLTAPRIAALAAVGMHQPRVHRRVRVGLLVTGDELLPAESTPQPWQVRDSNGPALSALLAGRAYAHAQPRRRAADELDATIDALRAVAAESDMLFVTGGVSMGNRDFVPAALGALGARTVFHKLPQRPGRPILAAVLPSGAPVLALPGNPVSVLVTARRIGLPVLRRRAGFADPIDHPHRVSITGADEKSSNLWWHRPVRLIDAQRAALIPNMGSGDVVAVARSDGFVELPPGATGAGPWPVYAWRD